MEVIKRRKKKLYGIANKLPHNYINAQALYLKFYKYRKHLNI